MDLIPDPSEDYLKDMFAGMAEYDRQMRWCALKAMWLPAVKDEYGNSFVSARGDEWTFWKAVKATIAVAFNRRWRDEDEQRSAKTVVGNDIAFWDAHASYQDHNAMVVWLYPNFRFQIFSDGG